MSESKPPPGFYQFEGQTPDGTGRCFFVVSKQGLLKHAQQTGDEKKYLEGFLIPEVLEAPSGTWMDLKRPGQETSICYTGKPKGKYQKDETIFLPCPPGQVFAVFVAGTRARGSQYKVMKWYWIQEADDRPGFPVDHATRFGERLWPRD